MRLIISGDKVILDSFPYEKFLRDLERNGFEGVVKVIKVLERSKFLFFKTYSLVFHKFFALEFYLVFNELTKSKFLGIGSGTYKEGMELLKKHTWITTLFQNHPPKQLYMDELQRRGITLKPYQERFLHRYAHYIAQYGLKGQVVAFEQGLGKTRTAIATLIALKKQHTLIVCPKSLLMTWKDELVKLGERDVSVFPDTTLRRWVIVNYDVLGRLSDSLLSHFDSLIVDEAQYIRNIDTLRTSQLVSICTNYPRINDILLLSGTPIKKDPIEWLPYLVLLDPNVTEPLAKLFLDVFMRDPKLAEHIAVVRMRMLVARELKSRNLSLPQKSIVELKLSIPDVSRYVWDNILKELKELTQVYAVELRSQYLSGWIEVRDALRGKGVSEKDLHKFIVICLSSKRTAEEQLWIGKKEDEWLKLLETADLREKLRKVRVLARNFSRAVYMKVMAVVFHARREECVRSLVSNNWTKICKILDSTPQKSIIAGTLVDPLVYIHSLIGRVCQKRALYLDSTTPDRFEVVKEFKSNDDVKVLVGTIGVLGVGLTLIEADKMIVVNLPWRYADLEQLMDRIHRIGQTNPVTIYLVRLKTDKLNVHDHMAQIALRSKEEVEKMLGRLS